MRLLAAEVMRLFSRRFTLVAMILVFAAVGAFQLIVNSELTPPSAAEVQQAQGAFEQNRKDWEDNHTTYEQDCKANNAPGTDCTIPEPQLSDYLYRPTFSEVAGTSVTVATYLAALGVFMVAGSFVGAEFSSGSLANWLTFIPQRGRVFASKLVTIAGFGALVGLVAGALALVVPLILVNAYGGTADKVATLAGAGGRGILISVALAALGFCIGIVARHTAAAIGVLLGYLVLWFVRNLMLAEVAWAQRLTPWTPEGNIAAILEKKHVYTVPIRTVTADGYQFDYTEHTLSLAHGLTYWAVLLAVVIAGAVLIFRRRDLT